MSGRYHKTLLHSGQVKTGLTRLHAIVCTQTLGGDYTIYDSANASTDDPKVVATVTPGDNTELLYKSLTLKNGLYIDVTPTIVLMVIYE